jgi:hypothetical protein
MRAASFARFDFGFPYKPPKPSLYSAEFINPSTIVADVAAPHYPSHASYSAVSGLRRRYP